MNYYVGVDGGGTKTEFVLTDESGTVLKRLLKSGCNPNDIGVDDSARVILNGLHEIANAYEKENVYVFAGVSGAGVGDNATKIREKLSRDYPNVEVENDLVIAVESCLNGKEGVAVICGTGISCCLYKNGEYTTIGGYGYLFEDGGSGYAYGRDAVKAAIKYEDGYGEQTVLLSYLQSRFQKSVRASLGALLLGGKSVVAALCPLVFGGAAAGDKVCQEIIKYNLQCTVSLIKSTVALYNDPSCTIGFIGGLSRESAYREKMQAEFGDKHLLCYGTQKPVYGAVRKAVALANKIVDEHFENNYATTINR